MKLLLKKDIPHLGIVGDIVDVSTGYGRNYLLPQHLAVAATKSNMKMLAEERKKAEERRRLRIEAMTAQAEKLRDVEVTISAAANAEGVLYGSVGPREIASALRDEGHDVDPSCVLLADPIRRVDTVTATVRFTEDIKAEVKVWVVRSQASESEDEHGDEDDRYDEGSRDDYDNRHDDQ